MISKLSIGYRVFHSSRKWLPGFVLALFCVWSAPVFAEGEKTVLLIGSRDMADNVGKALEEELDTWKGVRAVRFARVKKGLTHTEGFDWLMEARRLQETIRPDWVVIYLGSKDYYRFRTPEGEHFWGSPEWRSLYQARVEALLSIFKGARIWWVGPPTIRHDNNNLRHAFTSILIENTIRRIEVGRFLDLFAQTSDERGEYTKKIKDLEGKSLYARTGKIGFTKDGARWVAAWIAQRMADDLNAVASP